MRKFRRIARANDFKDEVIALAIKGYDQITAGCYLSNFKDSTICNKTCKNRSTCEKMSKEVDDE